MYGMPVSIGVALALHPQENTKLGGCGCVVEQSPTLEKIKLPAESSVHPNASKTPAVALNTVNEQGNVVFTGPPSFAKMV